MLFINTQKESFISYYCCNIELHFETKRRKLMPMALQKHVVVLLLLACLFTSSYSYQFMVGGKDGWVPNPSVSYNTWSQHMRFQINDSVLFKYKQGADSVLEVSKDDYDKCNTGNPIKKMEDGNSIFTLDRSGPFYFISGNKDNCDKGQKLQIIVISIRNQGKPPSTTPPAPKTPAPGAAPPAPPTPSPMGSPPSPPSGGSSPAAAPPKGSSTPGTPSAPSANSPAGSSTPGTSSPNGAPISTPTGKSPTTSPTPAGSIVSPPAPATGGSMSPAVSPVANGPSTNSPGSSSPAAGGPAASMPPTAGGPSGSVIAPTAGGPAASMPPTAGVPAGSMSPAAGGPSAGSLAPAAGGPSAGSLAPAGGPSAGGPSAGAPGSIASGPGGSNTPADINSPAASPENPNSFAVKAFTPSIVLVSAVLLVLTVALGEFII